MNADQESEEVSASPLGEYARRLIIHAERERVFDAIATVDGPRHWWTTKVTGSAAVCGELRFGFAGLDEQMVMRVSTNRRPLLDGMARCLAGAESPARSDKIGP